MVIWGDLSPCIYFRNHSFAMLFTCASNGTILSATAETHVMYKPMSFIKMCIEILKIGGNCSLISYCFFEVDCWLNSHNDTVHIMEFGMELNAKFTFCLLEPGFFFEVKSTDSS